MTRTELKWALEDLFGVSRGGLKESDSRDTVAGWTSLVDVQILTLISSEFGIEVDPEEFGYEDVGELIRSLEAKGAFAH